MIAAALPCLACDGIVFRVEELPWWIHAASADHRAEPDLPDVMSMHHVEAWLARDTDREYYVPF